MSLNAWWVYRQLPKLFNCKTTRTVCSRPYTSTSRQCSYADTIPNLKIGKDTRVIFQGFTGRQATQNARQSLAWGTKIVGGVTPGRNAEHLGLPVLPSVKAAKEQLQPDATGIFVAAQFAAKAIEEAIEAEIPLIAAVAEHIPLHDILRSRFVGANSPGIISAIGHCRIGFQPLPTFSPGHVAIAAKSGTLSYEAVASLTRAGLGQSLCVGIGGDILSGTSMTDALKVFETDDDTEAIVLIGEIGGSAEIEAANWIAEYRKRVQNPKPIVALVAGFQAPPTRVMGHAGAWIAPGEPSAQEKAKKFKEVGVTLVDHPAKFGNTLKSILAKRNSSSSSTLGNRQQQRGIHTLRKPQFATRSLTPKIQSRNLVISSQEAKKILHKKGYSTTGDPSAIEKSARLMLTIDRSARQPCIFASPSSHWKYISSFPLSYSSGASPSTINRLLSHIGFASSSAAFRHELSTLIHDLFSLFKQREAIALEIIASQSRSNDGDHSGLHIIPQRFVFDDAAIHSAQRHTDLLSSRDPSASEYGVVELEAAKHGIVYVKLHPEDPSANIGTLVNGAGLAMNTVDALSLRGGKPANFLDTGGKATAETVKKSFEAVLEDSRVKVIFVNIFGGLTLCDMIAQGVVLAFKELGERMRVPVVVRLRGTNEEVGQRMIRESGLELFAFDDFEEAAEKVIELADRVS
ncbi:MAG: hypothetical protein M1820_007353 [Bogoriella megaspora]|nr:MAG: hypothetical protein M1820_007353 [Bogoriella megaspora]